VASLAGRTSAPLFSFDPSQRISILGVILFVFIWNICTHSADQVAAQRYLSTPSAAAARRSVWVFSIANIALIMLLMIGGLALFYFHFHGAGLPVAEFEVQIAEDADNVLPRFIAQQLPPGLSGLLLAAMLAAAMSSLSSGINSISAVVVTDFLHRRAPAEGGPAGLSVPRLLAICSGTIAIVLSLLVHQLMQRTDWNLVDMVEKINHLFVAPLGAMFFAGIWFRRAGLAAVMLGFAAGVLTSFLVSFSQQIFEYEISFMWIMPAAFVVALTVTYLTAFVYPPPSEAQLAVWYRDRRR
jgi:SSS family solute:Na+ symporter